MTKRFERLNTSKQAWGRYQKNRKKRKIIKK